MRCTPPPLPLTAADRSDRLDELRDSVQEVTIAHEVRRRRGQPDGAASRASVGAVNVVFVQYGADVVVDAFPTRSRFTATVPLGPMGVTMGPAVRDATMRAGFALSADEHTVMRPDPLAGALVLATGMGRLEEQLVTMTGTPARTRLRFLDPDQPAAAPPGLLDATWRLVCRTIVESGGRPAPIVERTLEEQLLTALLLSLPHTGTADLLAAPPVAPTTAVDRAMEWIEDHLDEPLTVSDVAAAAGLSTRQLQEVFRRQRGVSPMEVVRDLRLTRAHAQLRGSTSVGDVAHACGFGHLSRFASAYRDRFGELPSETLQRRR
ncbi:MAG: helix-turn-helix transcriptional regulator [Pseudonocardia sp.]|uniref:helix-turn-helix transcriptional regulator n=1 Tax=unclassified Pseudonocardia TaxID=2619320 RepID=UPI000B1B158F|nr:MULTISPECIES: AraC family transcriptional regulator [unclassified Pseudonocardia]MBN9111994.1 helix-turn-helix transcriptional regulator [Pseudonocardia sp.]